MIRVAMGLFLVWVSCWSLGLLGCAPGGICLPRSDDGLALLVRLERPTRRFALKARLRRGRQLFLGQFSIWHRLGSCIDIGKV